VQRRARRRAILAILRDRNLLPSRPTEERRGQGVGLPVAPRDTLTATFAKAALLPLVPGQDP